MTRVPIRSLEARRLTAHLDLDVPAGLRAVRRRHGARVVACVGRQRGRQPQRRAARHHAARARARPAPPPRD